MNSMHRRDFLTGMAVAAVAPLAAEAKPLVATRDTTGAALLVLADPRRAAARALVHGAKRHYRARLPGGHGHRGEQNGADRPAAAAVGHFACKAQFGNSEIARDIDRIVVVHGVFGQPVDV